MRQILHINRGAFNLNVKHRAHICTNRDISHAADQDEESSSQSKPPPAQFFLANLLCRQPRLIIRLLHALIFWTRSRSYAVIT